MEYKVLNKRELDDKTLRDSVTVEDDTMKHLQVEKRNGLVFMRMKTRKIPS